MKEIISTIILVAGSIGFNYSLFMTLKYFFMLSQYPNYFFFSAMFFFSMICFIAVILGSTVNLMTPNVPYV